MNDNLTYNSRIWIIWTWKIYLSILNRKWCIGGKLLGFNYKCNLTFKNTFTFSFINSICTFKYSHLIELGVEGQKVASQQVLKNMFEIHNHLQTYSLELEIIFEELWQRTGHSQRTKKHVQQVEWGRIGY